MAEREPALLRDQAGEPGTSPDPAPRPRSEPRAEPPVRPSRREAPEVFVVGFWKRLAAAVVDLAIVIPAALLVTLVASKVAHVHLPPSNLKMLDVDMWIDLVLATDPALVMGARPVPRDRHDVPARVPDRRRSNTRHAPAQAEDHRRLRRSAVAGALCGALRGLPRGRRDAVPRLPVDGVRQREARARRTGSPAPT